MALHAAAPHPRVLRAVRAGRRDRRREHRARGRARRDGPPVRRSPPSARRSTPADRPSALAMANAEKGLHVRIDANAELAEPIVLRRIGRSGKAYTHHVVEAGANSRATLVIDHEGLIQVAANIEFVARRRRAAHRRRAQPCGRGLGAAVLLRGAGRPRRDLPARERDAQRLGRAHRPDRALRRPGRARRAARRELRGRRPALRGPAVRRPRRPELHVRRALQERAARRVRAHGLDRRRPHPAGRHRHEHVRDEPQPAAVATAPAPTPSRTSRSRPATSSAPGTPARRDDSTTCSCSTCSRGGFPRTRRAGSSCAASSPTSSTGSGVPELERQIMTTIEARLGFTPEENTA